ncbi:hypothetical protein ACFFLM_15465 [Deinococcus oregonensis]|uniref:Uncharacterized protein n=1 Tax=Deinococcus oregonensis TaxID=1805970 RepID=A0ABV6B4J2_9DEIO
MTDKLEPRTCPTPRVMLQSSLPDYAETMTQNFARNDPQEPLESGFVVPTTELYGELCRRARALGHDAAFLALLRRPGLKPSAALRLALEAVPALELLPLPVLAEEIGVMLGRARPWICAPVTRVWLA